MKRIFKTETANYTLYGALFGCLFPIGGTLMECALNFSGVTFANIGAAQAQNPLLWIIDSAPFFLGMFARLGGIRQDRIIDFANTLENKVTEKTASLQDAKKNLESALIVADQASKAKSEFLANMSHEIRTPMNGVVGMLDLLMGTDLNSEQKDFASSAQSSADALIILINDILDFSKIEAGKLDIEHIEFSLDITMDSFIDILAVKSFKKGIEFACLIQDDVPLQLKGDPGRLRQILTNLAGNAIKFVEKGEIFIKVSLREQTENNVTLLFEIHDTGIGIAEEKIDTLFSSFTQVDTSTTRKYGGTGLGLAISKQLTELMNGDIGVKSELNEGSTFWFTIVLEKGEEAKEKIKLHEDIKNTKLLVVDDNYINHEVFGEYLKSMQCRYKGVESAEEALPELIDASKNEPYKIALIDMQMPGISGIDLGKTIKKNPLIKDTILIMLSSAANRGDTALLQKAGFVAYLSKPIKKAQLFDCIRMVLSLPDDKLHGASTPLITSYKIEEAKRIQPRKTESLNILITDDNKMNQKVALRMLEKLDHGVLLADNGIEAVRMFKEHQFDLIFMDIHMPEMDGIKATSEIRKLEKGTSNRIPIVALTANAMKGDKERYIAAGLDHYMTKPMKQKDIVNMLTSIFQN